MFDWKFKTRIGLLPILLLIFFPYFGLATEATPLLVSRELPSKIATADATVDRMYVSEPYASADPRVVAGVNILDVEISAMEEFINAPPAPGKEMILVRYGVNDERVFDLLIRAKEKGIPVTFITDVNRALTYDFKEGEAKFMTDFPKATFQDHDMGPGLKRLLENGFAYNTGKFKVVSQPLYSKANGEMIPIMHEKGLLLRSSVKKAVFYRGTANMTVSPRYNRIFLHSDPTFIQIYEDHYRQLVETFVKKGEIRDMPPAAPVKMKFVDGSSLEVAFTNGRYNPYDRVINLFKAAKNNPEAIQISKIVLAEFALTNKDFVLSYQEYLNELKRRSLPYPEFILLTDAKFSALDGYGKSAVFAGYDTVPPMGGAYRGFNDEFLSSSKIYMYRRAAIDPQTGMPLPELVKDGEPVGRYLLHDKSASITSVQFGVPTETFVTGSLNFSAHIDNAEDQILYDLAGGSWLKREFESSVTDFIQRNPRYALPFDVGQIGMAIAEVTGHTDLEIPERYSKRALRALLEADVSAMTKILTEIAALPSTLASRPTPEAIQLSIARVEGFLRWYFKRDAGKALDPRSMMKRLRRFAALIPTIARFEKDGYEFVRQMNRLTWNPRLKSGNGEYQQKIVNEVWDSMNEVWRSMNLPGKAPPNIRNLAAMNLKPSMYARPGWNPKPVTFVFGLQDNLLYLPTPVTLFKKQDAPAGFTPTREISTSEYALLHADVGVKGDFAHYQVLQTEEANSFERLGSGKKGSGRRNYILDDVKGMIAEGVWESRKGPAWVAFEYALASKDSAANVHIVTGRGMDPRDLYEVFKLLLAEGKIKNIVPLENIHPLGNAVSPAARRLEVLMHMLFDLSFKSVSPKWADIIAPDGVGTGKYHIWTFSDNDWGNYARARDAISERVKNGDFKNTKIMLFYTGMNHPEHSPEAIVITPDGTPRKLLPDEEQNISKMLLIDGKDCSELLRYNPNLPRKAG